MLLLNQTLESICDLHQSAHSSTNTDKSRIREIIDDVLDILSLKSSYTTLTVSVETLGESAYLCYHGALVSPNDADFAYSKVFDYLKNNASYAQCPPLSELLVQLENASGTVDRDSKLLSEVIKNFSSFVEFLVTFTAKAENDFKHFIFSAFECEEQYFVREGRATTENAMNYDTEALLNGLPEFPRPVNGNSKVESAKRTLMPLPIGSSDPNFIKLCHMLLQLWLLDAENYPRRQVLVDVLIKYYKHSRGITYFEKDTFEAQELKVHKIYDFFIGLAETPGLLPLSCYSEASEALDELIKLPTKQLPEVFDHNPSARNFTHLQIVEMLANLESVVSVLNEYGLNLDPSFPTRARLYTYFVYDDMSDEASDLDFRYIYGLYCAIRDIVAYKSTSTNSDSIMSSIIRALRYHEHQLTSYSVDTTLIMRLSGLVHSSDMLMLRNLTFKWNRKVLKISQDESQVEIIHAKHDKQLLDTYLRIWFDRYMRLKDLELLAAEYNRKQLQARVFNRFWVNKLLNLARAEHAMSALSSALFLKAWIAKFEKRKHQDHIAVQHHNSGCISIAFASWRNRHSKLTQMDESECEFRDKLGVRNNAVLLFKAWRHWVNVFESLQQADSRIHLSDRFARLSLKEVKFVENRCFKVWARKAALGTLAVRLQHDQSAGRKQFFFQKWLSQFRMQRMLSTHMDERLKVTLHSYVRHWKAKRFLQESSRGFNHSNLKRKVLRTFRLRLRLEGQQHANDDRLIQKMFQIWLLKKAGNDLRLILDSKLGMKILLVWRESLEISNSRLQLAVHHHEVELKRKGLKSMRDIDLFNKERTSAADMWTQRKFLMKMCKRYSSIPGIGMLRSLNSQIAFEPRILMGSVIRRWKYQYLLKFEGTSAAKIADFHLNFQSPRQLKVAFKHWSKRAGHIHQLQQRLSQFRRNPEFTRVYFKRWANRLYEQQYLRQRGDDFHVEELQKKVLLAWYEKFNGKVTYLGELGDELQNRYDVSKMVEKLRVWNLKYIKLVKRNLEMSQFFLEKWERRKMMAIFELWIHKSRSKPLDLDNYADDNEDEFVEAQTSFRSNHSPLARRNFFQLADFSYMRTPLRKRSDVPVTPFGRLRDSPSKLLETNQRIKTDRIQALGARYKLARGNELSRTRPRLPAPEKSADYIPKLNIPPAPNFQDLDLRDTSLPMSQSPTLLPENSEIDFLVIDSAKRLRRIRPLVIPDVTQQPRLRYSTTEKLKEKLKEMLPTRNVFGS